MTTKQKAKAKAVLKVHGRDITPITITKRGKKVAVYRTTCNGKRIQAATYEGIIDKLAEEPKAKSQEPFSYEHIFPLNTSLQK